MGSLTTSFGRQLVTNRQTATGRALLWVRYLLKDIFSTDRASGSVNGTAAEPTGQTRTVVDGNNKLSITGGIVNFATGGVGGGNPGLWYPVVSRTTGLIFKGSITMSDTTSDVSFGYDGNQSGTITHYIRLSSNGTIRVAANTTAITTGLLYVATTYQVAIIARSPTGTFYFIKGGIYTYWTLLYSSLAGGGSLFPGVGVTTGTTTTFSVTNLLMPEAVWVPIASAYDTFTRADGAMGSTETTGPDETTTASLVYVGTTFTIFSNTAINTPNLGGDIIANGNFATDTVWTKGTGWTIGSGVATHASGTSASITQAVGVVGTWYQCDWTITTYVAGTFRPIIGAAVTAGRQEAGTFIDTFRATGTGLGINCTSTGDGSIDNVSYKPLTTSELFSSLREGQSSNVLITADLVRTTGTQVGVVINLDSQVNPQNFVVGYYDSSSVRLDKCVNGVYTSVINAAATYSAGATLRVHKYGTTYIVYYNNVQIGSAVTISDPSITNNTTHGLFSTHSSNSIDNFVIYPTGANNEHEQLDVF